MGNIQTLPEPENDLTVFVVDGEPSAAQFLAVITTFLSENPTRFALWDFSDGRLSPGLITQFRGIVEQLRPLAGSRDGGRTAVVCARDVDFGLMRVFQVFAETANTPFEINILRDQIAARCWLLSSETNPVA